MPNVYRRLFVLLPLLTLLSASPAGALNYYYDAVPNSASALHYQYPGQDLLGPIHRDLTQSFRGGSFLAVLDDDFNGGGLLTVHGRYASSSTPLCATGAFVCQSYMSEPAELHVEKQFAVDELFSIDPRTGVFSLDMAPAEGWLSFLGPEGSQTFSFTSNQEPFGAGEIPAHLSGGFAFISEALPTTEQIVVELLLGFDLTYLGSSAAPDETRLPSEQVHNPEPASALLLALAAPAGMLLRRKRTASSRSFARSLR